MYDHVETTLLEGMKLFKEIQKKLPLDSPLRSTIAAMINKLNSAKLEYWKYRKITEYLSEMVESLQKEIQKTEQDNAK